MKEETAGYERGTSEVLQVSTLISLQLVSIQAIANLLSLVWAPLNAHHR